MSYLLDTNVWIEMMKGADSAVAKRVRERTEGTSVFLSSIVLFELQYGIYKSTQVESNRERLMKIMSADFELIEFSVADAESAGRVRAVLESSKQPIGPYDTLIAGQALARGLTLITANHREFGRIPGLMWEDWS